MFSLDLSSLSSTRVHLGKAILPNDVYHCYFSNFSTPFISLEDVFLTGLCGSQRLKLRLNHNPEFIWRPLPFVRSHSCFYKNSITVHGFSPGQLEELWSWNKDTIPCNSLFFSFLTYISRLIEYSVEFGGGTL